MPVAGRVAVVGGGWAGLAAAVDLVSVGRHVTLYDTARHLGGRARTVLHATPDGPVPLDNGQHILIGAYHETLALMQRVGAPLEAGLWRSPLRLLDPHGRGLALPPGSPILAFVRGVLMHRAWPRAARWALLRVAAGWGLRGFRCAPEATVAQLTATLPAVVRDELIDPLCVAALNTPANRASAAVFLRVLRDALFSGPGCADLLLPRLPLSSLLPEPASRWLLSAGAVLQLGKRVRTLERREHQWLVDDETFDAVVLACPPSEAARLSAPHAPAWSSIAAAFDYEPIVTVYLRAHGRPWPAPMVALTAHDHAPAQFAFDLGAVCGQDREAIYAFVVSGAGPWVERGLDRCAQAVQQQALEAFPPGSWDSPPQVLATFAEKRATFACTPGLARPPVDIAPGLVAAGDYVEGPYPATLEGAVRAGRRAAAALR
jgi:squalene-associated FAD-dependent desaturase